MYKQVYVIYDDVITYDSFVWCILDHDMNHFFASSDLTSMIVIFGSESLTILKISDDSLVMTLLLMTHKLCIILMSHRRQNDY